MRRGTAETPYGYRFEHHGKGDRVLPRIHGRAGGGQEPSRRRGSSPFFRERRPRDLRRDVHGSAEHPEITVKEDCQEGALEQRGRRQALSDGARQTLLHVPPRSVLRRPAAFATMLRDTRRFEEITRGERTSRSCTSLRRPGHCSPRLSGTHWRLAAALGGPRPSAVFHHEGGAQPGERLEEPRWLERQWMRLVRGGGRRPLGVILLILLAAALLAPNFGRSSTYATRRSTPIAPRSASAALFACSHRRHRRRSLVRRGQWPWPRTVLARLIEKIAEAEPAVIGVDIVMSEPDRLSPGRLVEVAPQIGADVIERLARSHKRSGARGRAREGADRAHRGRPRRRNERIRARADRGRRCAFTGRIRCRSCGGSRPRSEVSRSSIGRRAAARFSNCAEGDVVRRVRSSPESAIGWFPASRRRCCASGSASPRSRCWRTRTASARSAWATSGCRPSATEPSGFTTAGIRIRGSSRPRMCLPASCRPRCSRKGPSSSVRPRPPCRTTT